MVAEGHYNDTIVLSSRGPGAGPPARSLPADVPGLAQTGGASDVAFEGQAGGAEFHYNHNISTPFGKRCVDLLALPTRAGEPGSATPDSAHEAPLPGVRRPCSGQMWTL